MSEDSRNNVAEPGAAARAAKAPDSVWLDPDGAASRAVVSVATIRREARAGRLVGYRVGGRKCWRFRPSDVDRWLEQTRG